MMKTKVSKEVYEMLINGKGAINLTDFIFKVCTYNKQFAGDWQKQYNIKDDDLINAYRNDFEIGYDFKIGDVVKWYDFGGKEYNETVDRITQDKLYFKKCINDWMPKKDCELVCKAENREDIKHD